MLSHTELPRKSVDLTEIRSGGLGRCRRFFWLGVAFDAVGVAVLFTGVFANLLFYDMLLYLGSIIIFVSLLWWIFWYTGNIEALPEDPSRSTSPRAGEVGMHRSGSLRFSLALRSVSNTFRRIHRRRRRPRLLPRVLQTIQSLSSTDPGQLEGKCDAGSKDGRTSLRLAKPVSVLNQLQLCSVQASRSLPLVPLPAPLSICTSRSQPVFSVTSQGYSSGSHSQMTLSSDSRAPVDLDPQRRSKISVASQIYPLQRADSQSHLLVPVPSDSFPMVPTISQSQIQDSVSSDSRAPVDLDPQRRSKISVASRIYPVQRADSQSHLLVPVPSDSFPMVPTISQSQIQDPVSSDSRVPVNLDPQRSSKISVTSQIYPLQRADSQSHLLVPVPSDSFPVMPMISQSQIQGSLAQESQLQNFPPASQTQPETVKATKSHNLATEVPVVTPGIAQTSQSCSPGVQEVPKNSSAKALETLPATSHKIALDQPDPSVPVSEVAHTDRQCDPTDNLPASRGVRESHSF
ncbi:uncharacterized protein LOC118589383 [Onychomys torridus]|uniref:uncharacterized protein LOC118589383 n=1 Tax=Onychomys torridus TaxID=38674 RepID=UPI00167FAD8A|nr:uncharacterized protein LOC118589383 [Onychomys torridus]